ncbi:hypothetical protein P8452_40319 [Trifolium repens]|nr:two-component response regulator ARR14 [Trifolium repens]WJX54436.1 hypothetical protein P8452_40319 [Trifolium repens]
MAFSTEIDHLPYRFPEGLRVFVIDHDTTQLNAIVDMCFQCNYEVTTCTMASFAIHLLRETKGSFDVIVIEAQMPDMDSYDFVRLVTQEIKIPVIMMGVDDDTTSARMKAIEKGACEYWVKPLNVNHINNMWQHVVTIQQHDQILRILEVKTGQKIMKRDESATKETNACVLEKPSDDNHHYQPPTKKNRLSWSQELHEKFLRAVNQLGMDKAKPRKIVELMDVPGLTRAHVSSHWQKLRLGMKSSSNKKRKLKNGMSKSGKQDEYDVPNNNERLEVVKSMAAAEQDQNVVLNSAEAIQCDNKFLAQQQDPNVFDDFEVSNMLITNNTNMMLDDPPTLLYDEAWQSSEYGTFGWC